jgi:hypothetical protein
MEDEERQRARFREHALRMQIDVSLANAVVQRFGEKGEPSDLEEIIGFMRQQFLKPTLFSLEYEKSKAGLEQILARLQEQAAKFREYAHRVTNPNEQKFVERWNNEMDTAIAMVTQKISQVS